MRSSNGRQTGHRHRGSSAFADVPDCSISMESSEKGIARLSFESRNIPAPDDITIKLSENLIWTAIDSQPEPSNKLTASMVKDEVIANPGLSSSQLIEALSATYSVSKRTVESRIKDAKDFGFIKTICEGREVKFYNA